MDKTAIKNYAIWARVQLIESCKQRAFEYGVTEDGNYASNLRTIGSRILTDQEVEQRNQLISQIQQKGYTQVMEEAAYTWFNRFIALRFMEVNGYLPSKVRVFTDENGAFKPEILKEAMTVDLEGIDRSVVIDLLEKQDNEALYKYLLITQCNALSKGLPYMFEKISNWTELLFPANLLRTDSVVEAMVADIPEEDWTDAVQIIGWLYQYYNSELKDETFALLKKNVKITKERIPAATQLFTPDWIVRYMVENSLGRLWYEGHKDFDKTQWKYYLDEAEQEPEVEAELAKIREGYSQIRPEDIKVIDPCMGSGHILVYAFDVLMQIYTSAGWSERDAARSILENNLYGLDIDDRAGQLAYFAVMMKARKYSRRIMSLDIKPNVMSIQDSSFMTNELIEFIARNDSTIKADLQRIKEVFTDAKEYGSILNVPSLGYEAILERIDELQNATVGDIFQIEYRNVAVEQLRPLIRQAMIMSQKYDVVVTNPPYMGGNGMSARLGEYVKKHYPDSKSDLFSCFIEKGNCMMTKNGFNSMVTMQSWMFLSRFEKMREKLLSTLSICSLLHMDNMVMGIAFGTSATVFRNAYFAKYVGTYNDVKFTDIVAGSPATFPVKGNRFSKVSIEHFSSIPGLPIAYWISDNAINAYKKGKLLNLVGKTTKGIITGNNDRYMRLWWEVRNTLVCYEATSDDYAANSHMRWFPCTKGGSYRKWYGNKEYIMNWEDRGRRILNDAKIEKRHSQDYDNSLKYQKGISWSVLTSGNTSFRFEDKNLIEHVGMAIFPYWECDLEQVLGYLNSSVASSYLAFLSPTVTVNAGEIGRLPYIAVENVRIKQLVRDNVSECKIDWDSFETSWDFKRHPLL